jgi:pSer/pThr/pTyr-binding forkhead associated (FHA) protein
MRMVRERFAPRRKTRGFVAAWVLIRFPVHSRAEKCPDTSDFVFRGTTEALIVTGMNPPTSVTIGTSTMSRPDGSFAPSLSLPDSFAVACKMTAPLQVRATHGATGVVQAFSITQPFALIGRAPTSNVRLDDPSISQCHAYLQIVEGLPYCIDLGSRTGVVWDDGTHGRGWVMTGQKLRVGVFDVLFGDLAANTGPSTPVAEELLDSGELGEPLLAPASLDISHGGNTPYARQSLDEAITLIGRHPVCQVRSVDESLGYFHCILVNTGDGVWFLSLVGRKGIRVNGRLTRLTRLRDGDLIELGKTNLRFRANGHTAHPLAVRTAGTHVPQTEVVATIPQKVAESVAVAIAPFREMVDHFQKSFVTIAEMFTRMQQDHAAMMCEQMRQVQELSREVRELREEFRQRGSTPELKAPVPLGPPATTTPARGLPAQRDVKGVQTPVDAHSWFLEQLARLGQLTPAEAKQG